MEIIFLVSLGIVLFYIWAQFIKVRDRMLRNRKERAIKWEKMSQEEKYGRRNSK